LSVARTFVQKMSEKIEKKIRSLSERIMRSEKENDV